MGIEIPLRCFRGRRMFAHPRFLGPLLIEQVSSSVQILLKALYISLEPVILLFIVVENMIISESHRGRNVLVLTISRVEKF
jgi:hypothetical protein